VRLLFFPCKPFEVSMLGFFDQIFGLIAVGYHPDKIPTNRKERRYEKRSEAKPHHEVTICKAP